MSNLVTRPAVRSDARVIAELYSIASDGVSDYIWSQHAGAGEALIDAGQRRYEREDSHFGFRSATMVDMDGTAMAMLLAFPMIVEPDATETDPVLMPLAGLEEPDSYYICAMAVYEEYRGRGIGRHLLAKAEQDARAEGLDKLSLIVFEQNTGAKRLYERSGFVETAREAIVPHPLIRVDGDALLMVRSL